MAFGIGLLFVGLIALGWFRPRVADRWFQAIEKPAGRLARKKGAVVIAVALAAVFVRLAVLPLEPVPLPVIHDEFSNLLAADTFAHGRLTNPPHPMWMFFDTFHVLQQPTYASKYPPATGALLAVGQILGHPWLGTLLGTSLMCMALAWMLQGWVPPGWALLGGVLAILRLCFFNYWFDGYLGASVSALGAALVLGAYPRLIRRGKKSDATILGAGAVLLAASRPLEGFLFCLPVAVALGVQALGQKELGWWSGLRRVGPAVAVLVSGLAFLGFYDWRVTHDPFLSPYLLYHRTYFNYPIFAWQHVPPPQHYANPQFERFFNVWNRTQFRLSWSTWVERASAAAWQWWAVFIGLPLTVALLALPRVLRDRRMRLPMVQFVLCSVGLLSVVWFQPHYAAPLFACLILLLVQCLRHLRRFTCQGRPVGVYLTRLAVVLAIDWVVVLAGHAARNPAVPWSAAREQVVRKLEATPGAHLVVVEYAPDHNVHQEWVYNAADIDRSRIVWARAIPGRDLTPLLDYYQNRRIWTLKPDVSPPELEPYPGHPARP